MLASANDGWFLGYGRGCWCRRSAGLRIAEKPVEFLRRADKSSTVRFWRDSWHYLRAWHDFRGVVGISRRTKSPIYWTGHGYNLVMRILYGAEYERAAAALAGLIADAASVVEVCCGTAQPHLEHWRTRACRYLGSTSTATS